MSFRRDILESIGGFRVGRVGALSIGREDDETELCIRARHAFQDSQIIFQPTAKVLHKVPAGRSRLNYFARRCYSEGLSKAAITRLFGREIGLAAERRYTLVTLPIGMVGYLWDLLQGELQAGWRAGAISVGFAITLGGYLMGKLFTRYTASRQGMPSLAVGFAHTRIGED